MFYIPLQKAIRIHWQSKTYSFIKQYILLGKVLLIYLAEYCQYTWQSIINIIDNQIPQPYQVIMAQWKNTGEFF